MDPEGLLRYVCDVCDRLQLVYFVTGSTATIAYGEPRFTNDIDVVVELPAEEIEQFCQAFPSSDFYVSRQAATDAVRSGSQFNVIHPASGLKIDFIVMSKSAFDQSRRSRRRELAVLPDRKVWFAAPEDVIVKKMVYYREGGSDKHLRDIAGVLRVQQSQLDRGYIELWARELGLRDIWKTIIEQEATRQ